MKEQNASGRTELEDMAGTLQFLLCAVVVTGLFWVSSPELGWVALSLTWQRRNCGPGECYSG